MDAGLTPAYLPGTMNGGILGKSRTFLAGEVRQLLTINKSDRPWEFPIAIAFAAGLPLFIGAWFEDLGAATPASIGAMVIIYLPRTSLSHRLATLMALGFAMTACYGLGQVSQLLPWARIAVIAMVAVFGTIGCRFYRVIPPGAFFLIMVTAVGAYAPAQLSQVPVRLGIFVAGTIGAVLIALLYSLYILGRRPPEPDMSPPCDMLDTTVEAIVVGTSVALSLVAAQLLSLDKPYWAPVSCLAVLQGASFRAVWNRQAHRILGTLIGLGITWLLIDYAGGPWGMALAITVLVFAIETAVVRHYAFAMIFITPMTILLAETAIVGHAATSALLTARFADTAVGALTGLAGGTVLHDARMRAGLKRIVTRLRPRRVE